MATTKKVSGKTASQKKNPAVGQVALGASSHNDMAAGLELSRNALAREKFEFLLKSLFVLGALLLVSIVTNVYLATRPVEYRYFATDVNGGIREIETLNRSIQSTEEVLNWATGVVTKAYSMSFANYRQQLADLQPNFTEAGWQSYNNALERSEFIQSLVANKFVTSAVPRSAPVIVGEGLVNGVYGWRIEIPIIVTFDTANYKNSQEIMMEMVVVRRPASENPRGLGVAQITSR